MLLFSTINGKMKIHHSGTVFTEHHHNATTV